MSPYLKSALILAALTPLLLLLQVIAIIVVFQGMAANGSGGLGAVSFGLSEVVIEYIIVTALVWAVIYWRSRRRPGSPVPRRGI